MVSKKIKINFKIGIHSRPAVLLIQKAKSFSKTKVFIEKNKKKIQAKSLIGILSLGIVEGDTITLITEGKNEKKALNELTNLIKEKLSKSEK